MLAHDLRSHFHNENETALSVDTAPQLAEAWTFETAGSVTGTPAVVGDRVYVVAGNSTYALNAGDGAVAWRNERLRGTSSPAYHEGRLYVNDSDSVLHTLDATSGAELWQATIDPHPNASGFSSPVVAGDLVIVGSASFDEVAATDSSTFRGGMVAFDRATGREAWRHYTTEPPYDGVSVWSTASVDVEAGVVYGSTGNNYTGEAGPTSDSIFALDLATGRLLWNRQLSQGDVFTLRRPLSPDSDFGTNPVLYDAEIDGAPRKLLAAGQKSGMFWVLDRSTGEVVWSRELSKGSALIGGVFNNGAYDGERIVVAANNATSDAPGGEPSNGNSKPLATANVTTSVLMALDPRDGTTLWERQLPAWVWAPITLANGVGFVAYDRHMQAFDVSTGAALFTLETAGTIASGAAIAGGRAYFGSGVSYLTTTADSTFHALAIP